MQEILIMSKNTEIAEALLAWYRENKRSLPWRDRHNAYYTWISEVMLQQTRASAVIPYFERFIHDLPDVAALCACPDEKLMKLWQGLGYYSRARNLKAAAAVIVSDYDGSIPSSFETLLKLPGIGRYTAGSIASIAYGIRVPAVDGNVLRIAARLSGYQGDIKAPQFRKVTEAKVMEWMPDGQAGDFNQALMELGATVCVPNGRPDCGSCPVREKCEAGLRGLTDRIPAKQEKKERPVIHKTVFVILDGSGHALCRRPDTGLLAGLYELPNTEGWLSREQALQYVADLDMEPLYIEQLPERKHIFTHLEWKMKAYRILVKEKQGLNSGEKLFFVHPGEEENYAVPSAFGGYMIYTELPEKA